MEHEGEPRHSFRQVPSGELSLPEGAESLDAQAIGQIRNHILRYLEQDIDYLRFSEADKARVVEEMVSEIVQQINRDLAESDGFWQEGSHFFTTRYDPEQGGNNN